MPTFRTAGEIVTGCGCVRSVGECAAGVGSKALLVTGRTAMRESGATSSILDLLRQDGVDAETFEAVEHDPDVTTIDAGRSRRGEAECDVVIGLGGGSAIDAAKAIAGLANEPEPTAAYHEGKAITRPAVPLIAVPTTSGTGSEVTKVAVLSNRDKGIKKSIRADTMWPAVALLDPELTVSCPPSVTAASGMDALVQAIESYTSIHATPLTEALSFDSARRLLGWLEAAYDEGENLEAREQCAYAALMAGMALANARLGAVHGIAHPLGARTGMAHGAACALLMPPVMRMNADHVGEKYDRLSDAAGQDIITFVDGLLDRFGLRGVLEEMPLDRGDFPAIAAESMPSGSLKANPKAVTEEDVLAILDDLASG
jgi:alcohol dehydrogenase class IV